MRIVIVGNGKMAEILGDCCRKKKIPFIGFHSENYTEKDDLVVHFGSGRQLPEALEWCNRHNVPLIQGSTGQQLPSKVSILVVNAPNLALPIVKLLSIMPTIADTDTLAEMKIGIIESHQASKKSVPGTAKVMAEIFGISETEIISIRDREKQLQLGVPEEYLDGHGYHWITLEGGGVTIELSTKVNGREAYAYGAISLAKKLLLHRDDLKNRVYQLSEM